MAPLFWLIRGTKSCSRLPYSSSVDIVSRSLPIRRISTSGGTFRSGTAPGFLLPASTCCARAICMVEQISFTMSSALVPSPPPTTSFSAPAPAPENSEPSPLPPLPPPLPPLPPPLPPLPPPLPPEPPLCNRVMLSPEPPPTPLPPAPLPPLPPLMRFSFAGPSALLLRGSLRLEAMARSMATTLSLPPFCAWFRDCHCFAARWRSSELKVFPLLAARAAKVWPMGAPMMSSPFSSASHTLERSSERALVPGGGRASPSSSPSTRNFKNSASSGSLTPCTSK
mmetsp:Transcript_14043/g.56991  ORF Transcript_14043/g.56991 Transcript_14043/m.56991 type:complete len:282 (-) Transcript_14043:247-1092(-)